MLTAKEGIWGGGAGEGKVIVGEGERIHYRLNSRDLV